MSVIINLRCADGVCLYSMDFVSVTETLKLKTLNIFTKKYICFSNLFKVKWACNKEKLVKWGVVEKRLRTTGLEVTQGSDSYLVSGNGVGSKVIVSVAAKVKSAVVSELVVSGCVVVMISINKKSYNESS